MRLALSFILVVLTLLGVDCPAAFAQSGTITLLEALEKAERNSPAVIEANAFASSIEGRRTQASSYPNPDLDIGMERFAGTRSSRGYDNAEIRVSIGETFELGGKREKRVALADAELNAAKISNSLVRIDVKTNVQILFNEALRLQELKKIHEYRRKVASDFLDESSKRFNAGIATPIEKAKAQVSFDSAKLDFDRAQIELESAMSRLSVALGEKIPSFSVVLGNMKNLPMVPAKEAMIASISDTDQVALRVKEAEVRKLALAVEKSVAIPDVRISGGMIYTREDNGKGVLVGVSMPLPIFQRNQGRVFEASKLVEQSEAVVRGEAQSMESQVDSAYRSYNFRRSEALYLENNILKTADAAMEFTMKAFRLGRLNYLEVLESQRTQFESRLKYLDAISSAQESLIELEKLTKLEFHLNN